MSSSFSRRKYQSQLQKVKQNADAGGEDILAASMKP
jgi:hypothetical protein